MGEVKWKLMVDWGGEEQFTGAHDEITSDTLGFSLRHMRDLRSEYIDTARLDIRLANSDHKYSPPNPASLLSGTLKPGRKVWLCAAFPCDEFEDTAGVSLSAHAPNYGSAFSWTMQNQDFRIAAGGGAQTNGAHSGRRIAAMDFGIADASFGSDFTRGTDSERHGGLVIRYADTNNFLYLRINGSSLQLRKVEQGSDTPLAETDLQWSSGERRFVQVALHSARIRIFVNRVQIITAISDFNTGATRHGLYCDGAADHLWQHFGGWASLFYGNLHSIEPHPNVSQCRLRAFDEMRRLEDVTLYMYATSSFPQTSDEVLDDILDYAGVDAESRALDDGIELVPSLWSPPLWGVQATDEIRRLQDEEDGFIFVDGHGFWRLQNCTRRATAPHTTPKASVSSQSSGTDAYFSALEWSDGVDNIENKIFMRIRDAANHGHRTAWTLGETPYFDANQTREFLAESKSFDVVGGQLRPLQSTDYTANTKADGSGEDITSQLSVTHPATQLYNGKGTLIRVRFGSTSGYLTKLNLRTVNALTFNAPLLLTAGDSDSQDAYGQRIRSIDARWTREAQRAQATLDRRLARRGRARTVLSITLPNGSDGNTLLIIQTKLSDRISVDYEDMGVDSDFFVEGYTLEVGQGGKRIERTLLLQQV